MNAWNTTIGAICYNVFLNLVEEEPKKIDDLLFPLSCGLYLSANWHQLNFSKNNKIENLRLYVDQDVTKMKKFLLVHPDNIKNKIKVYSDHLNGSLGFSALIIESLYNGNEKLYKNNLRTLYQECLEIIFWYIQDLKDESLKKQLCDYTKQQKTIFNEVLHNTNLMNPL